MYNGSKTNFHPWPTAENLYIDTLNDRNPSQAIHATSRPFLAEPARGTGCRLSSPSLTNDKKR